MVKSLLLGGVLGGITLFAWLGFSWAVLPFHMAAMKPFPEGFVVTGKDLDMAAPTISGGWPSGIYFSRMPDLDDDTSITSPSPEVPFMVYLQGGYQWTPPRGVVMLKGLLLSIIATTLVTLILLTAGVASYKTRVGLSFAIGAVVALAGPMTFGNFFFFPKNFLIPEILDQLIGWALAGLVIAIFTKPLAPSRELTA
jgi:hypothetical protein